MISVVFSPPSVLHEVLSNFPGSLVPFPLFSPHSLGRGAVGAPEHGEVVLGLVHAPGGPAQDVVDQVVLKEPLPSAVRSLGEDKQK